MTTDSAIFTPRQPGSAADFVEILGSLILAKVNFTDRLAFAREGIRFPSADFPLAPIPEREALAADLERMFGVPTTGDHATLGQWAAEIAEGWRAMERPTIRFSTSGSTGEPTVVEQDLGFLMQEVAGLADVFHGRKRVVSFVPRHHIYGFIFSILLPARMGVPHLCQPSPPTPGVFGVLEDGDLAIGFPLFWAKLVENGGTFAPGVHGVTSSGPCPREVNLAVRQAGLESLTEIYGSTETSGLGYRHHPDDAYELMAHWTVEDEERVSRADPTTDERLVYAFQDNVRWDGPRRFVPVGRKDKAQQVGGINVYPEKVRVILLDHPDVRDCAVRLMRPEEGSRLKAFIVWEAGAETDARTLRDWLRDKVKPAEVPGGWAVGDAVPTNAMGKVQDW